MCPSGRLALIRRLLLACQPRGSRWVRTKSSFVMPGAAFQDGHRQDGNEGPSLATAVQWLTRVNLYLRAESREAIQASEATLLSFIVFLSKSHRSLIYNSKSAKERPKCFHFWCSKNGKLCALQFFYIYILDPPSTVCLLLCGTTLMFSFN